MIKDTIEIRILNNLLDKYERSSFYRENKPPTRRIIMNLYAGGQSDFDYYDIEQSDRRISVNRAVERLEKDDLVFLKWVKGEYRHIIEKVWLNAENLQSVYKVAKRKPKGDEVDSIYQKIEGIKKDIKAEWIYGYLQDICDYIIRKRTIPNNIPKDNIERDIILRALVAIDNLDGIEVSERVFSLQIFGNTKTFEDIAKSRIISILRRYTDYEDTSDEDILKQIGIVKYPEQFEFCGNMSITIGGGVVDYRFLPGGGVVYSSDFSFGRIRIDNSITSVMSIENRANYIDYIKKKKTDNEIVIYHGGQYSPRKRVFLQAVANAMPKGCAWYHWSDIDYGGFIMLSRLRREIAPGAIAYRMSSDELERYNEFTASIKPRYAKSLENLKSKPELSDCYECIDYMLLYKIRLEQEAMLTDIEIL